MFMSSRRPRGGPVPRSPRFCSTIASLCPRDPCTPVLHGADLMQVNPLDQTVAAPEGAAPTTVISTFEQQDPEQVEEPTAVVVCPFLFEDLDAVLTNEADGSPTLFHYGCVAGCVVLAPALLAGTFFTPGLPVAWAAGDPLLGLAVVAFALIWGVGVPMLLAETRRTCRGATCRRQVLRAVLGPFRMR